MTASCERPTVGLQATGLVRVESTLGTPVKSVDAIEDVLGGRESVVVVDLDHASLSRQARGALRRHGVA